MMNTTQNAKGDAQRIDTRQLVLDAVRDLRALDQPATRETVQDMTGLKGSIVDDRLKHLVDEEKLRRVMKGHYDLVTAYPESRIISQTLLPDGCLKLELGDDMLLLTPKELRDISMMLSGHAESARVLTITNPILVQNAELTSQIASLERKVKALTAEKNHAQLDLPHCDPA